MPQYNSDSTLLFKIEELTTQLNQKDKELRDAIERFTRLFEHSPIGMMITVNRKITFANQRMHEIAGYKQPELIGQSTRILYNSEEEYHEIGTQIECSKEFTMPVHLKKKGDGLINCMMKFTKCEKENYVSLYIEAGA